MINFFSLYNLKTLNFLQSNISLILASATEMHKEIRKYIFKHKYLSDCMKTFFKRYKKYLISISSLGLCGLYMQAPNVIQLLFKCDNCDNTACDQVSLYAHVETKHGAVQPYL